MLPQAAMTLQVAIDPPRESTDSNQDESAKILTLLAQLKKEDEQLKQTVPVSHTGISHRYSKTKVDAASEKIRRNHLSEECGNFSASLPDRRSEARELVLETSKNDFELVSSVAERKHLCDLNERRKTENEALQEKIAAIKPHHSARESLKRSAENSPHFAAGARDVKRSKAASHSSDTQLARKREKISLDDKIGPRSREAQGRDNGLHKFQADLPVPTNSPPSGPLSACSSTHATITGLSVEIDRKALHPRCVIIRAPPLHSSVIEITDAIRGGTLDEIYVIKNRHKTLDCMVVFQTDKQMHKFLEYTQAQGGTLIRGVWCFVEQPLLCKLKILPSPELLRKISPHIEQGRTRIVIIKDGNKLLTTADIKLYLQKAKTRIKELARAWEDMIFTRGDDIRLELGLVEHAIIFIDVLTEHTLGKFPAPGLVIYYGKDKCSGPVEELPVRVSVDGSMQRVRSPDGMEITA